MIAGYYANPQFRYSYVASVIMIADGVITFVLLLSLGLISAILFIIGGVVGILETKKARAITEEND